MIDALLYYNTHYRNW